MRVFLRITAISASVIAFLFTAGCDRVQSSQEDNIPQGIVVFEDDFSGERPADHWQSDYDGWRVDQALHVEGAKNDALWLQVPLPEEFRVSFSARSDTEDGDIKFEILGDGKTHESGYIGIFGGWQNQLNIIARLDEHGNDRLVGATDKTVEIGRTYQMDVVRNDHRLRWYIDEELFLTFEDGEPLDGDDHRYFGFNNWDSSLVFEDLRIYDLNPSP